MCKYCYVDDEGESVGKELKCSRIKKLIIWEAYMFGDESAIRISSDLASEKVIKINYCPMCGRQLRGGAK